jgi:hypothetical protein
MPRQVRFEVPVEIAFDYLVDPLNRAEWQSSLRTVESVIGVPRVGQRWIDVTVPGLRPLMETTALVRPHTWTEVGRWHGIHAELTLDFTAAGAGCLVAPTFRVTGRGPAAAVAYAVDRVAVFAVLPDLRKAARLLARRAA